jgi:hypothetical protein
MNFPHQPEHLTADLAKAPACSSPNLAQLTPNCGQFLIGPAFMSVKFDFTGS